MAEGQASITLVSDASTKQSVNRLKLRRRERRDSCKSPKNTKHNDRVFQPLSQTQLSFSTSRHKSPISDNHETSEPSSAPSVNNVETTNGDCLTACPSIKSVFQNSRRLPSSSQGETRQMVIQYRKGDLFDAPSATILVHACNCRGSWGGGIAVEFRQRYPEAYSTYQRVCRRDSNSLFGGALLIVPKEGSTQQHYVGCIFTSKGYGRAKDKPGEMLKATDSAMRALLVEIQEKCEKIDIAEIRMPKINSGLFAVPWARTERVLRNLPVESEDIKFPKVVVYEL